MTLEARIRDRKVIYMFNHEAKEAFEIALLYYLLAKRKDVQAKISDACYKAVYWLKKAGVRLPPTSDPFGLEEIEKILVCNKDIVDARHC
jgi:hypothetical protein